MNNLRIYKLILFLGLITIPVIATIFINIKYTYNLFEVALLMLLSLSLITNIIKLVVTQEAINRSVKIYEDKTYDEFKLRHSYNDKAVFMHNYWDKYIINIDYYYTSILSTIIAFILNLNTFNVNDFTAYFKFNGIKEVINIYMYEGHHSDMHSYIMILLAVAMTILIMLLFTKLMLSLQIKKYYK